MTTVVVVIYIVYVVAVLQYIMIDTMKIMHIVIGHFKATSVRKMNVYFEISYGR